MYTDLIYIYTYIHIISNYIYIYYRFSPQTTYLITIFACPRVPEPAEQPEIQRPAGGALENDECINSFF